MQGLLHVAAVVPAVGAEFAFWKSYRFNKIINSLASIGLGVAAVTEEFVQDALDAGTIRRLHTDFEIPARSLDMCTLRGVTPTAAASAFMDMIRRSKR